MLALQILMLAVATAGVPGAKVPSYDDYVVVLGYVDSEGRVDYAGLKDERASLDAFVASLDALAPATYASWSDPDKIAFWINAYNALTLRLVVDHYPIAPAQPKAGFPKAGFPKNSIGQIPGVWDQKRFGVMGQALTLDEIEHQRLRAAFKEPRIHMALVCAAVSCPKLRNEPYRGATLDDQLDAQARVFLSDLRKFHIDRESGEVWTSRIFEWFADDFLPQASATDEPFVAQRKAITAFASKYVSAADRRYLETADFKVAFFEYDWTLNEQPR